MGSLTYFTKQRTGKLKKKQLDGQPTPEQILLQLDKALEDIHHTYHENENSTRRHTHNQQTNHLQIHYNESQGRQVNPNQNMQQCQLQNYIQNVHMQNTHENEQFSQEQLRNGSQYYIMQNHIQIQNLQVLFKINKYLFKSASCHAKLANNL